MSNARPVMTSDLFASRLAFGAGAACLGLVTLAFGSVALQYQPVPAALAGSSAFVTLSGILLILCGAALPARRSARAAAFVLTVWFLSWIVVWQAIRMPWDRLTVGHLLPGSEVMVLVVGAALLASGDGPKWRWWDAVWLRLFAAAQIVFGLCHFIFMDITAGMIPAIFPAPEAWAIATGVAHLVAAAALLAGYRLRLTAALLCAMYFVFTLVVCAPILMADLKSHLSWLMVTVTALHAASAWVVHQRAAELERTGLLTLLKMDRAPADELA